MASSHEEQLIAAVNDKMDPITLLVWCEQSLTPKELSTLNRLLRADDGTLAQEIGWNILEMVLPMLKEEPQEAENCLDCIARRGNPREVIVKVAEVLEKLGEDVETSDDGEESVDELPTFASEADRIHLGTINLDGKPVQTEPRLTASSQHDQKAIEVRPDSLNETIASVQFRSLMSMLTILHLRIKTQYPSRFLATSLPAALGAYRRIGVTAPSTLAFLSLLGNLSGRKPKLPARVLSVSADPNPLQMPESSLHRTTSLTVSMPDSEPEIGGSSIQQASQNERDIVLKLLQAVLLEALDDFIASLQSRNPSHMSWTPRLREMVEPRRLVPGKQTESQKWHNSSPLRERDSVLEEFLKTSKDLKFSLDVHFKGLMDENGQLVKPSEEGEDSQSVSEYPSNPAQVPFPPSGLLFLYAAQHFYSRQTEGSKSESENSLFLMCQAYQLFRSEQNTAYSNASFATEDALLLLLYLAKDKPQPTNTNFDFEAFFMSLATFCAEFPDPQFRDAAHNIATALFHNQLDVKTKLNLVIEILQHQTIPANLKAVAIGWVKDEIAKPSSQDEEATPLGRIRNTDLDFDPRILPLLFPERASSGATSGKYGKYEPAEASYYVASLNLLCVLAGKKPSTRSNSAMQAAVTELDKWRSGHRGLESDVAQDEWSQANNAILDEIRMDLWALDDALARSNKAMKHTYTA